MKVFRLNDILIYNMSDLNLEEFKSLFSKLPRYLFSNIKQIFIYPSNKLNSNNFEGYSVKESIFINCDNIKSNNDIIKILIHECFHTIESDIKQTLSEQYKKTCIEYLNKKKIVLDKIKNTNLYLNPNNDYYSTIEYQKDFDFYLYKEIGYDNLYFKIFDIFPSAYSMTSVSEYIAVCFEVYFFENREWLSKYCSEVYKLIEGIENGK